MRDLPTELWKWDAIDLAHAIAARTISSREAVAACLARLDAVNPILNAVVDILSESALVAADGADRAVAKGDVLGPLHGVPVTIKENVDQLGTATANGVVAFKDLVATEDSPPVANLRAAGAVIIGRTNTASMSLRWTSENDLHGRTLNPWSPDHTPGGSSGGAGVAVASGIGPIAHANDLFGSIRFPAYCTGTVGLRPSWGRTPAYNATTLEERGLAFQTMAVQGPIARRVCDLRPALIALSRRDQRDPWWVPAPMDWPPLPAPIRVAMSIDPAGAGVHPVVAASVRRAAEALASAGHAVEEVDPPDAAAAGLLGEDICMMETRILAADTVRRLADAPMKRQLELTLARRPALDLPSYMRALAQRATLMRRWALFMETYPLILCPNSTQPPYRFGADIASQAALDELYAAHAMFFAVPLMGVPSVAVPTGVVDGLPTGVQIIAQRFREDLAIDAAAAIESRCPMPTPIDPLF
ncbi:MAG: amidase [Pseudolabrys sp.]|nr:amidase [Pseudolabrys sp.]